LSDLPFIGLAPYHSQMCMDLMSARPSTFRFGCTSSSIKHGSGELPDLLPLGLATCQAYLGVGI
jgi:hypothetical protein